MPNLKNYFEFSIQNTFASYLRSPLRILFLAGLGRWDPNGPSKSKYYVYSIYSIFVLISFFACASLNFAILDWSAGLLEKNASYYFAVAIWIAQAVLSAASMAYALRGNRFEKLIGLWTKYKLDDLLTDAHRRWIRKRVTIVFLYTIIISITQVSLGLVISVEDDFPLTSAFGAVIKDVVRFGLITVVSILLLFFWFIPQYVFFVVSIHVACCWRAFGDRIRETTMAYEKMLAFTVRQYADLSHVVDRVNAAFGLYALIAFSTNIVTIIFNAYTFTYARRLSRVQALVMAINFLVSLIMMAILASAALINEAAEKINEIFNSRFRQIYLSYKKSEKNVDSICGETSAIGENLRGTKIAVSPCRVFTITRGFFVTIFSFVASYYIVLVQFAAGGCNCERVNGSASSTL